MTDIAQEELEGHATATLQELRDRLRALEAEPAELHVARLSTATRLSRGYDAPRDKPFRSIGVLNPNSFTVYLGPNGSATLEGEAWPVGPEGALVLPVSALFIEVGIDAADTAAMTTLGTDTALVYVLKFSTVQPFHRS